MTPRNPHEIINDIERMRTALLAIGMRPQMMRLVYRVTNMEYEMLRAHCNKLQTFVVAMPLKVRRLYLLGWLVEPTYDEVNSDDYYADRRDPRGKPDSGPILG